MILSGRIGILNGIVNLYMVPLQSREAEEKMCIIPLFQGAKWA
jgi:hypothetical protein